MTASPTVAVCAGSQSCIAKLCDTTRLPGFYRDSMRRGLGSLFGVLPEDALDHDHLAYLKSA